MRTKWLMVCCVALLIGCSDDPKKETPTPEPDGEMDGGMDAEPDAQPEPEPDVPPEPQNDRERILFIPETESWDLPDLDGREVHVVRTAMGVPHVYAENRLDMGYVLGFVVARDRFFIMDLQRRLAQGTISELLGGLGLAIDMESRLTGMTFVAQRVLEGLSEEDGAYMDAYANGINEYIKRVEARETPPPSELQAAARLLGAGSAHELMEPFTRADLAAMVAVIMYQTNFETGDVARGEKLGRLESLFENAPLGDLRRAGARGDFWEHLDVTFDYASTPGFAAAEGGGSDNDPRPLAPNFPRIKLEASMAARSTDRLARLDYRLGRKELDNFGSNTWAVQGSATSDGLALVAGDGHLPLSVPSLMYQIGMNTVLFGEGEIHEAGLLITSLPVLAVGTNGQVAWSQVNPVSDIVDWYREEFQLGDDGLPVSTLFQGEQQTLQTFEETHEVGRVGSLGDDRETVTWTRYQTFDGRFIFDIEGRELAEGEEPGQGENIVTVAGRRVVPGDMDNDGVVSGISLDYTAYDATGYIRALVGFTKAKTVRDYQESSKGLIGNMLYSAVADQNGDILFTSYQAVPCRTYLDRDENGRWGADSDPSGLLDGTRYGGFTIPSLEDGKVDESQADDPYRCVVPFDETPQIINPAEGFVVNANNQPAPIQDNARLDDDPWYIGGPWSSVRADSIAADLRAAVEGNTADEDKMSEVQGNTRSRLGEVFSPYLIDAIRVARDLEDADAPLEPHQARLLAIYQQSPARFNEVETRLDGWSESNYEAASGVETFYNTPDGRDLDDAVVTMIFNAWLPRAIRATFGDEDMEDAFRFSSSRMQVRALDRFLDGRGPDNLREIASFNPETGESVFFDTLSTEDIERSEEILLTALAETLVYLSGETQDGGTGGFETEDMSKWLWGLRHQVRFESLIADFLPADSEFSFLTDVLSITTRLHPLATPLPAGDPRRDLKWFPRPGDNFTVDAASPGFSGTNFTYGSGPVMRMVIALGNGEVKGRNIVPGGQSGLVTSPYFADQAALWLGNETIPMLYFPKDVAEAAIGREVYK